MFRNYWKTAYRYLWNHKTASLINLISLGIGLSVCFFALLYVRFELSYDTFHEKSNRIYRLVTNVENPTGTSYESSVGAMGPAIQDAFPEVENMTRIFLDYLIVQKDQDSYGEEKIAYADSSFFSVFNFPLILGDPNTVLNAPNTIVLTESLALKYFGKENPVGKTLVINGNSYPSLVTGVMEDMPANSHIKVDMLVSMETLGEGWMNNWKRFFFYTYLLLPDEVNTSDLSMQITEFIQPHIDQNQGEFEMILEPLESIYLYAKPRGSRTGSAASGSVNHIYIISLVTLFVLIISCFNFVNLTTALSMKRADEVGIRKSVGASKWQLIMQFLADAILLSGLAFIFSVLLNFILFPFFNQLAGKTISDHMFENYQLLGLVGGVAISLGLVSGIYPAFFLAGFHPLGNLNGHFSSSLKGLLLRKVLVISQFAIAMILMIATLVLYLQVDFMQSQALGFKKEQQLVVDFQFDERVINQQQIIKQTLLSVAGVDKVSFSSCIPGRANHTYPTLLENAEKDMQHFLANVYFIDEEFLSQYAIEVIAGRDFSSQIASDLKEAVLINEVAANQLGFLNLTDALGKKFDQLGVKGNIIGVVKDFHFHSYEKKIQPLVLRMAPGFYTFMNVKVSSQNMQQAIEQVKGKWSQLLPEIPLIYFFADEAYDAQYNAEERFGSLFVYLTIIAILVSSLGLFGLSVMKTSRRVKEIGVRKILGASGSNLYVLLSKEDIKLIAISILIAIPVANYFTAEWLAKFAYRIDTPWWAFIIPAIVLLTVSLLTIGSQTIKIIRKNPVDSLRHE